MTTVTRKANAIFGPSVEIVELQPNLKRMH